MSDHSFSTRYDPKKHRPFSSSLRVEQGTDTPDKVKQRPKAKPAQPIPEKVNCFGRGLGKKVHGSLDDTLGSFKEDLGADDMDMTPMEMHAFEAYMAGDDDAINVF